MNQKIAIALAAIASLGISTNAAATGDNAAHRDRDRLSVRDITAGESPKIAYVTIGNDGRFYRTEAGRGIYRVRYNYTGRNWTHADVAPIHINTEKPIAILPMQYTYNGLQAGASINGTPIGRLWNTITVEEMKRRLEALGFYVLTPTIQMYGESITGFQGLEHFIAGVHKGNRNVQTVILTADAHIGNAANPRPGAQMLVTGLHRRDYQWENRIQSRLAPFYRREGLVNIGPRVRGGKSNREGSSLAWHPAIERAAEYNPNIAIIEVAKAIEIVEKAGSISAGRQWAAPVFDAVAMAMTEHACTKGASLSNVCGDGGAIASSPPEETADPGAIAAAPVPLAERIEFRPGSSAALRWGTLSSQAEKSYVLNAGTGQLMTIRVNSPDVLLTIKGASGNVLVEADGRSWRGRLPASEDYYITVVNEAGTPSRYTMSVVVQ